MIKIATAECFTHGKIGHEIHILAQGYGNDFGGNNLSNYRIKNDIINNSNDDFFDNLSLSCSLFIPTLESLENILKVKTPEPYTLIKGIKVFNQENDLIVAELMAKAVKNLSNSDIGIGTTAGIGKGGIAIKTNDLTITTTSDVYADLTSSDSDIILKRQISGIEKTLGILLNLLNDDLDSLNDFDDLLVITN